MRNGEIAKKDIEKKSKRLGKLIEDNNRILPYDQMVVASIRIILHELDISKDHKVKILSMVPRQEF